MPKPGQAQKNPSGIRLGLGGKKSLNSLKCFKKWQKADFSSPRLKNAIYYLTFWYNRHDLCTMTQY
jgi:hypothetical protein